MASVEIRAVRKRFGETAVNHGVDIDISHGEPVAIVYSFFVEHYVSSLTGAIKE